MSKPGQKYVMSEAPLLEGLLEDAKPGECVLCGTAFELRPSIAPGGRQRLTCSETCNTERKRLYWRAYEAVRRGGGKSCKGA